MHNYRMVREIVHPNLLDALREVFVSGGIPPGAKVPEAKLCERFGISRTPLREALKVLAAEGQIELLPNRGARVSAPSIEEVDGLFSITGALEGLAGEQACMRVEDDELVVLQGLHDQMLESFRRRDLQPYYTLNRQIHEGIVRAAHNSVLKTQYLVVNARIRQIRFTTPMTEEIWIRAMAEHEGMMNALQRRDSVAMSSSLKTHLKHKSEDILKAMRENASCAQETRRLRRSRAATAK